VFGASNKSLFSISKWAFYYILELSRGFDWAKKL
jgi:hypothetical protein